MSDSTQHEIQGMSYCTQHEIQGMSDSTQHEIQGMSDCTQHEIQGMSDCTQHEIQRMSDCTLHSTFHCFTIEYLCIVTRARPAENTGTSYMLQDYSPKRMKFDLSEWEMKSLFDPSSIDFKENEEVWVDYRGRVLLPPFSVSRAEEVAENSIFDVENLPFRQPESLSQEICTNI
ncbi:Hypothetical predicted protein [Mytilus galloprovincialis]|uniref:Uncharacterized protein n=1 Tax=Mytilus galloprovincialis TaxID=29158 RepID=A0A8B6HEP9_MYTGA|nr:Hypothetical predicted protein [Mytilus galloprovincialis]